MCALSRNHFAILRDEERFAGLDVANDLVTAGFEDERLAGNGPLGSDKPGITPTQNQRANSEWVAECEKPVTGDEGNRGIRSLDTLVQSGDGIEDVVGRELFNGRCGLKLVCEHIDEKFGVGIRVEVTTVILVKLCGQFPCVREVPVVNEDDSVGGVDEERLCFRFTIRVAAGRVAHVAEPDIPQQSTHVTCSEGFSNLPLRLRHVKGRVLTGRNTGGVLPAVLKKSERVIDLLIDGRG
ncbi:unannotated protein [freshwater metagenome]|uniref:Unannotated protein n=1 Tax=freshwater metagenome TaxID=449393 RepID=A0A6J6FQ32_9ZZZZ